VPAFVRDYDTGKLIPWFLFSLKTKARYAKGDIVKVEVTDLKELLLEHQEFEELIAQMQEQIRNLERQRRNGL
jgi:hypothetical protein